jgi:hypothetical protein
LQDLISGQDQTLSSNLHFLFFNRKIPLST